MLPPLPPTADPVAIFTAPESPKVEAPDKKRRGPLTPRVPASVVRSMISPLLVFVPVPDVK